MSWLSSRVQFKQDWILICNIPALLLMKFILGDVDFQGTTHHCTGKNCAGAHRRQCFTNSKNHYSWSHSGLHCSKSQPRVLDKILH